MNRQKNLPQIWQDTLQKYLIETGSKYKELSADAFKYKLRIIFEDRSYALFNGAFYWIDEELEEVCVFTEHCGYHIFYLPEILLETVDWDGKIIKTDDYRTE